VTHGARAEPQNPENKKIYMPSTWEGKKNMI
jgi:hypothetical protein